MKTENSGRGRGDCSGSCGVAGAVAVKEKTEPCERCFALHGVNVEFRWVNW